MSRVLAFVLTATIASGSSVASAMRRMVIGTTVQGRPIIALAFGSRHPHRTILVVGCVHGNECAGLAIINALRTAHVLKGVELWLVPEMNPDGTAADTRQNAHGVDLNRNFPFQWQPISDPTYYSGPSPGSEPETQAAMRFIRRIRPAVAIWYHQHQDLVDMSGGDHGVARRYAHVSGLTATCLPWLPGTAVRWQMHVLPRTAAFVVELPAGPVDPGALARHVKAVQAMERGERSGSPTSCGP